MYHGQPVISTISFQTLTAHCIFQIQVISSLYLLLSEGEKSLPTLLITGVSFITHQPQGPYVNPGYQIIICGPCEISKGA